MKKFRTIAVLTASIACAASAVPFAAFAADTDYVYGTMNIPYAEFYKAEISSTPFEVDAVSSATTSKWSKNGAGELFEGTYNQANDDGTGTILGVTYPVAIKQADLDSLSDNYGFIALDTVPEAYKTVAVNDGKAEFSAVVDENKETLDSAVTLLTSSNYGDYQVNPATFPANTAVYGVIINTTDGNSYALRHEQNIWRNGQISWSAGLKTTEGHGNTLDVENYDEISGKTISSVVYITKAGYLELDTETYVPLKFSNELSVENGASGTGSVALTKSGFPADYNAEYTVGDGFTVSETAVSYTNAQPGTYTLTVTDTSGKYADYTAKFTLSTAELPVAYSDGKLIAAEGFTADDAANFIKNLSTVGVNGTDYAASGKRAVKIVGEDGTIDFNAVSGTENIFDGSGNYTLTFTATGYETPLTVTLGDGLLYGTMDIPYAEFYKAELEGSNNAYEVDAVSSATTTKWSKNGAGELFEGSYNQANEDGTGTILGVTYPVAITQEDLNALSDNYNFTALSEKPEAYKNVTVTDGKAEFSAVVDENAETFEAAVKISTETPWGDYLVTVDSAPESLGAIYGTVFKTKEGDSYAFRHEQNIWRGQFAWSSGFKTTEPHGNTLDYENFQSLMGETITEIVYIGKGGYYTVSTETYVPIKFNNKLGVEDGISGTGSVKWVYDGFPTDYSPEFSIADNFTIDTEGTITYKSAQPGTYTLSVSDKNGKYAGVSTDFTLSTADMPVTYDADENKLVAAKNFTDEDAANFIKNLTTVTVNDTEYSVSGRGAVAIVKEDGSIDFDVQSGRGDDAKAVFDGTGNYKITFTANGYDKSLVVTLTGESSDTDSSSSTSSGNSKASTTTTKAASTTAAKSTTTTTTTSSKTNVTSSDPSPKTGESNAAAGIFAALSAAGLTAFLSKKRKKK